MTKRDTLFLLLPCTLLIVMAVLALTSARAFSFGPQSEQRDQHNFEEFATKVQSGQVQITQEKWIDLVRSSRQEATNLEAGYARILRILASGILVGVLIQMYVIFRVKAGLRRSVS